MTTSAKMDDDFGQLTEKILNLTLEIIYLLTGEGYKVVKEMSGEPLTPSNSPTDTPPPSLKNEINSKKILEVTNKIIDLLTGESGSLADLNIIVKEEDDDEIDDDDDWVYIGYKHHFNNVRVKDLPPLMSPDGSRKRNPPRPRDSTLDDHNYLTIPHHDQCEKDTEINSEDSEEEETPASGDLQSLKEDGRTATLKNTETSLSDTTDGSRKRNPSESCPHPLDFWNCILEDHNYVKRDVIDECEEDVEMNSEDSEEGATPIGDQLSEKENEIKETSLRITIEQECNVSITSISSCTSCEDDNEEDNDTTQLSPVLDASTQPLDLNVSETLSDEPKNNESFSCSECEDSFSDESCSTLHVRTHTGQTAPQEDHTAPHHDQCGKETNEETEVEEEGVMPSTEDEHDVKENGTTQHSPGGDSSPRPPHRNVEENPSVDELTSTKLKYRKIFSCPECENSFADTLSYILHMEMHSGLTVLHEDRTIPRCDQGENQTSAQTEVKKEEVTPVKGGQQSTKEAGITTTVTESQMSLNKTPESENNVPITRTRSCTSYEDNKAKDIGATQHSPEGDSSTRSPHPTVVEALFVDVPKRVQLKSKKTFSCSECENSFTDKSSYILHMKTHSGKTALHNKHTILHHEQCEKETHVQTEVHEAEESSRRSGQQKVGTMVTMKGKKTPLNITPEHDVPITRSRRSASHEDKNSRDRVTTQRSSRGDSSSRPPHPTVSEKLSTDNLKSDKKKNKIISCPTCKKSFSSKSRYAIHTKRRCGPRQLHECKKEKEIQTEVNKEEVTPMRVGLRSMKNAEVTTALKVKRTLSISPEPGHHIPNTRKRLRASCPDSDVKDNDTAQHFPAVDLSTQPLYLTVSKNKKVLTSTRGDLKSMKDVAVMETKKVKKTSLNITSEHGHDFLNTRRSLRTSHPDYNKKENGTTPHSLEVDCSAHALLPTAPKNKEVMTPMNCGLKSKKEVAVMETKKEKKTSLDITPEHVQDLPNTRRSLRTSHPESSKKENGSTRHPPEVVSSAPLLHPSLPENKEGVTPMRSSRQCMKEVGMMVTTKNKKFSVTPENEHDVPNTRSRHRTSHPDDKTRGNVTTQHSSGVISTARPSPPSVTRNDAEVTPVRGGRLPIRKVGIMERLKARKTSLTNAPENKHGVSNTRKSLRSAYAEYNTKENGTTQHSPGPDASAKPLHHPTMTEQFLDINKMFFSCSECGKSFTKKLYFAIHMRMHTVRRPFQEERAVPHHDQCEKNTDRKEEVNVEEDLPMKSRQQSKKQVGTMATMKKKKTSLTINPTRGHDVLNTRRRSRSSFPDRQTENKGAAQSSPRMHSTPKPLRPAVPKKRSIDEQEGGKHKSKKACPECGKFFCTESYIAIHLRTHTGKRPYVCFKCGKSFTYNSSLLRHQRHHSEVRPHKCSLCGKCFKEKSVLRQHLRSHTGERPYPCPECAQRFTQKEHLHRHLRVHRGETPFACTLCGKRFTRKDLLTQHEQRHVNERPYTCPECGNGFTNQFCLARHLRLLHNS